MPLLLLLEFRDDDDITAQKRGNFEPTGRSSDEDPSKRIRVAVNKANWFDLHYADIDRSVSLYTNSWSTGR